MQCLCEHHSDTATLAKKSPTAIVNTHMKSSVIIVPNCLLESYTELGGAVEAGREGERERKRERGRESVCVCESEYRVADHRND